MKKHLSGAPHQYCFFLLIKYNSSFSYIKKQTQHRVCGVLTEISVLYCQPTECIYLRLMVPCATAACFYI